MEIRILAGDISAGLWSLNGDLLRHGALELDLGLETKTVTIQTENDLKQVLETQGWKLAGGITLGLLEGSAGLLLDGMGKEVTALIELESGKRFLALMKQETYTRISGFTLGSSKKAAAERLKLADRTEAEKEAAYYKELTSGQKTRYNVYGVSAGLCLIGFCFFGLELLTFYWCLKFGLKFVKVTLPLICYTGLGSVILLGLSYALFKSLPPKGARTKAGQSL